MSSLLFIPAFLLGFPLIVGVWKAALQVFKFSSNYANRQTSFIVTLCLIGALLSLMTAPAWLLGWQGYAVVVGVYLVFLAIGGRSTLRVGDFLSRELDGDASNDVPLPGDKNEKKN